MQLGLVTYMWGADWDVPTLIKNCAAAGFKGVELRSGHKHGVEPGMDQQKRREVAKRFADSAVELVGLGSICEYHSADPAVVKKNIEETKKFIRLAHDLGASGVKVRPNGLRKDQSVEATLEQIGKALHEVAEFGEGHGMQIRLEVHGVGTMPPPRILKIMQAADHDYARVCWNCNGPDLEGDGLKANFDLLRPYFGDTVHIHNFTVDYPWKEFYGLLKQSNYEGWTLLEDKKPSGDDIVQSMKEFRATWEKMVG